jgi:hypothetical protein
VLPGSPGSSIGDICAINEHFRTRSVPLRFPKIAKRQDILELVILGHQCKYHVAALETDVSRKLIMVLPYFLNLTFC